MKRRMKPGAGMRIAYVINSMEGGGAALPVPAIAGVLRDGGAAVRIFALTRRDGRAIAPIEAAGFEVVVRDGGERDHLAALRWMRREARAWGATHMWTSLSRATLLGLALQPVLGLPLVCWQHNALLKPWNRRLLRALQGRARLWVADSQQVAELTRTRLAVGAERLSVWPIFAADPAMPAPRAWQPGEPVRIGTLGRLHPNKGYDILIEAMALLRQRGTVAMPQIRVAGEGAQRPVLEAAIARHGLTCVDLRGYVEDTRAFLAAQHLYVQPSRAEGFCIAAHEAMAAGLPVLASAVGEMPHSIVPGETGLVVPPLDPVALADALEQLLARPERLHAMGEAARAHIGARFSRQRFAEAGQAILGRLA